MEAATWGNSKKAGRQKICLLRLRLNPRRITGICFLPIRQKKTDICRSPEFLLKRRLRNLSMASASLNFLTGESWKSRRPFLPASSKPLTIICWLRPRLKTECIPKCTRSLRRWPVKKITRAPRKPGRPLSWRKGIMKRCFWNWRKMFARAKYSSGMKTWFGAV